MKQMKKTILLGNNIFPFTLLFSIPLMNAISNRLHIIVNFLIIVLFFSLILIFNKRYASNSNKANAWVLVIPILTSLLMSLYYKSLMYGNVDYSHAIAFAFGYLLFLFSYLLITNYESFLINYFPSFINYIIWISFLSISWGHVVLYTDIPDNWQLIYRNELGHDYSNRPSGLFGQPSINIAILLYCYALRLYLIDINKIRSNIRSSLLYLSLIVLSVYFQKTGTGYLGLILFPLLLVAGNIIIATMASIVFFIALYIFYSTYSDLFGTFSNKLSYEYFASSFDYFFHSILGTYIDNLTFFDFIFGIDDQRNIEIDFGLIYILGHFGIFFLILLLLMISYINKTAANKYVTFSFFLLLILSMHYPTIIYPTSTIIFLMLMVYIKRLKV